MPISVYFVYSRLEYTLKVQTYAYDKSRKSPVHSIKKARLFESDTSAFTSLFNKNEFGIIRSLGTRIPTNH